MSEHWRKLALHGMLAMSVLGTGCDKIADTSRASQDVIKNSFNDTKSSWMDFFTYHPPLPASLPQTRYCYQMQSDTVCYDSEQPMMTSKLVGYQDGENISWVQPGGGALGASGGPPIALRPLKQSAQYSSNSVVRSTTHSTRETGPVGTTGVVPSTTGQISVNALPPATRKPAK